MTFDIETILRDALDSITSGDGTIQADPAAAAAEVAPAVRLGFLRALAEAAESTEHNQLSTYCANVSWSGLTDDEIREHGDEHAIEMLDAARKDGPFRSTAESHLERQSIGYEVAASLPLERLRELFEADDYGKAWEVMNGEQHEYYEQDEGEQRGYNAVAVLLGADPNDPYAELRGESDNDDDAQSS